MEKTTRKFENRDGLEQLATVEDNSVRLVLTDPPYLIAHIGPTGKAYEHFDTEESFTMDQLEKFVKEWYRVLTPGGTVICWFDVFKFGILRDMATRAGFGQRFRTVSWIKDGGNQVEVKLTYVGWGETAMVFSKGPTKEMVFNNKDENGKATAHRGLFTSRTPRGKARFHPTQKPVDLFEELICLHTNPGDIVLDSFCGSGATPVAAELTKRSFIGAEINKEYFDKAQERLAMLDSEDRSQSSLVYTPEFKAKEVPSKGG
jgi:DNA modification methylase